MTEKMPTLVLMYLIVDIIQGKEKKSTYKCIPSNIRNGYRIWLVSRML